MVTASATALLLRRQRPFMHLPRRCAHPAAQKLDTTCRQVIAGYNATAGMGSKDSYWIIRNSWG